MFSYEESCCEEVPFLADYTMGDIIVLRSWNFHVEIAAFNYLRSKRSHRILDRIDPDDYDVSNDSLTFYEKLADIAKFERVSGILQAEVNEWILEQEKTYCWFLYTTVQHLRIESERLSIIKKGWRNVREYVIAYHQKLRFMEFASYINYYVLRLFKCKVNPITRLILLHVFELHPFNVPKKRVQCDDECDSLIDVQKYL